MVCTVGKKNSINVRTKHERLAKVYNHFIALKISEIVCLCFSKIITHV